MSTTAVKGKKKTGSNGSSFDNLEIFLLHLPTTIWYLIFCYAPMFGVVIAFKNYKVKPGKSFLYSLFVNSKWSGFKNFEVLFKSSYFSDMLRNTLVYNFIFIVLGVVIPVTLAILINNMWSQKLAKVCQTMMFLPHFLSWVVISYFVFAFLSTDKGLINSLRNMMGMEDIMWYQGPEYWPGFLIFINTWKTFGYSMVVYMATITGIDASLYESTVIDGASKWQQCWGITIPLLRPVISIMFIMNVGHIFSTDFGLFYQVTRDSGSIINVTQTLDVYVYKALMESNNYNYSSAVSLLQSVLGCILLIIANFAVKKIDPESGIF